MNIWILTYELNDYDQDGEYFVAAFSEKPHHTQLTSYGVPENRLRHVLNGGGRVGWENKWFYLRGVEAKPSLDISARGSIVTST